MSYRPFAFAVATLSMAAVFGTASAADLPKATQEVLKELSFDASLLAGLDEELNVPKEWLAAAQKERTLKVSSSWDPPQFAKLTRAFKERYPFIEIEYSRSSFDKRSIAVLMASRQGRVITDVMTGFGGSRPQLLQAKALAYIGDLPTFNKVASDKMRDPQGYWVGHQISHWCISYNTDKIRESELPATWDDMLTNKKFMNGNLGLGNRPQLWFFAIWEQKGDVWGRNYLQKLFSDVRPQLRKEGVNALISLATVGEIDAALPGSGYRTQQEAEKGAKVSFVCPAPVPVSVNELAIVEGTRSMNAARLFVNWLLSKEGQILQFATDHSSPIHKDFQENDRMIPYAAGIIHREQAFRSTEFVEERGEEIYRLWNSHWEKSGRR